MSLCSVADVLLLQCTLRDTKNWACTSAKLRVLLDRYDRKWHSPRNIYCTSENHTASKHHITSVNQTDEQAPPPLCVHFPTLETRNKA